MSDESGPRRLRGRLLVATPAVDDPNFAGTVVLMLEHTDEGAVGVVLNRPSDIDVAEHLPGWMGVVVAPPVVFLGGPVSPNAALCLAQLDIDLGRAAPDLDAELDPELDPELDLELDLELELALEFELDPDPDPATDADRGRLPGASAELPDGWDPLVGRVGTVDLSLDPGQAAPGVEAVRIFAGYSGWAPGQLEAEIADGGWFVVDADPCDALAPDPDELWRDVLRRQVGTVSLFADYPPDPSMN